MNESIQLKNYGYDVMSVTNSNDALNALGDHETRFDLVLMDIDLGSEMDGTETAKLILEKYDIPLLFLSSHTEPEVVTKTENITSYGYVVKNSGITILDASIKMAFKLYDAYQHLNHHQAEIETSRKELEFFEKRYRRLFESAKDGILILNANDGMIVDVNPYLMELLGYSKEELLNKKIWDISAFQNIDYSRKLFKELQKKDYVRYDNLPLETRNGILIHVEFVSNVYLVDREKVIQCNIRDITERKHYEKTLTNDIEKKDALFQELQHRTKNSFHMIMSLISIRSTVTQSVETKNVLEELTLRVKSISDLYSLLYETESFYDVPLRAYCNKVIESMFNFSNDIVIRKSIDEVKVSTKNAATIGMILVELLSNSIKYAFPKSKEGVINVDLKSKNSKITLIIEDNGIGLPENFDMTQIKSMGLHLVDLMVNQLHGKMKLISENGTKIIIECNLS
ncbi:PAS domain S-box protein [Leptospira sp. 'Mane']|uniref:PAS domain S-box protein n=1 Tax=Leptospira sp. 'Mane' TaxID=3387407 RepID=UPI00398B68BB